MKIHVTVPRVVTLVAIVAGIAISMAACRPNETAEGQGRDVKIKTSIKAKLASDVGAATLTAVQVNVTNGVVTLAGPVHSADEKSRIESIARAAEGVVSVNNALQVLTEPSAPAAPMTTSLPAAAPTP